MPRVALASILAFLAAAPASAVTLAQICNRFSHSDSISACFGAARGLEVDEKALDICNRFSHINPIVACVESAAGREYTEEEVAVCNRFSHGDPIASCLRNAGRLRQRRGRGGPSCSERVSYAIADCRRDNQNPASVLACLERRFQ